MGLPEDARLIARGFDVEKLNEYVDWFNLLSIDFHSPFEPSVNHHAPLFAVGNITELNVVSKYIYIQNIVCIVVKLSINI